MTGDPWWALGGLALQGWQCPCCRNVYAPNVSMCFRCSSSMTIVGTSALPWTPLPDVLAPLICNPASIDMGQD